MKKIVFNIKWIFYLLFLIAVSTTGIAAAQSPYIDSVEVPVIEPPDDVEELEEVYTETEFNPITQGTSDSVKWKQLPGGYVDGLEKDKAFEYVKTGIPRPKPKEKKQSPAFTLNRAILFIAVIAFAAFLIWYLADNNIIVFRGKSKKIKEEKHEEEEHEDIFSIQYKDAIQKAVQHKNYRQAIRLHYLQLLKTLSDKKIINYRPDKTNFDYLMQLRPTTYYNDFFAATRNYEYSWYGLFEISPEMYEKIEPVFSDFYKKVS